MASSSTVTPKGKSYWWKDRSGNWHYHKPNTATPVASSVASTSDTKPANIPSNVTPTKPTGGATQNPDKPTTSGVVRGATSNKLPKPTTSVGTKADVQSQSRPTTSTRASAKAALDKVGLGQADPKGYYNSQYKKQTGSAGNKPAGSGVKVGNKSVKKSGFGGLTSVSSAGGRGRAQVDNGQGSRKVYDSAKSRLLKNKKRKGF